MLHVITGSMAGGKSSKLVDYTEMFQQQGKIFQVFYPAFLEKETDYVVSREDNKKVRATKVYKIGELYNLVKPNTDVVVIDEISFMCNEGEIDELMSILEHFDKLGKQIYLFGIALDYSAKSFPIMQRLLPYADTVIVLHAKCDICGEPAYRCVRYQNGVLDLDPNSDLLQMESDNVRYEILCKDCYRKITNTPAIK